MFSAFAFWYFCEIVLFILLYLVGMQCWFVCSSSGSRRGRSWVELSVAFLDCNALSAFSAVLSIALAFSAVQFSNMYFKYNAFKLSPVYKNPVQSTPSP